MRTVYQFAVLLDGDNIVELNRSAGIIHVGMQNMVTFWAVVDPEAPKVRRVFRLFGTGHPVPDDYVPVGSVFDGPFVWHLFERVGLPGSDTGSRE